MSSTTPAAERPSPTSPEAALPKQPKQPERAIQPEVTESGLRWPVLVKAGGGRLRVERISGSEYRYVPVKSQPGLELPEVKVGDRWVQVKGAFEKDVQEAFLPAWRGADVLEKDRLLEEAEVIHALVEQPAREAAKERRDRKRTADNLRERVAALKDPKKLRVRVKSALKKKLYPDEAAAVEALNAERLMYEARLAELEPPAPTPAPEATPEEAAAEESAFSIEQDPLDALLEESVEGAPDDVVEPHAADAALTPTVPIPELQKTVQVSYGQIGEESFADWMVKTLREHTPKPVQDQLEREAAEGLSDETLERESREDLTAANAARKLQQDQVAASVNPDQRYESLRETLTTLGTGAAEAPLGETFAKEVAAVAEEERPTASKRRFLPGFVLERLRSAASVRSFRALWRGEVGEFGEAQHFRRETNEAARAFLESVQDRVLSSVLGGDAGGNVVDSAVAALKERLGKLRTFAGEGMDQRIAARESELRELLERELASASGLLEERDVEALADKLRSGIDRRYWWRYVTGAAELAVAGAVGGYFLFAKGAEASAVQFGPRVAKTAGKRAARAALQALARSHVPAFELPGITTEVPREIRDSVNMRGSIWATVRRAANEAGLNPTNSQLGQMVIKVCKENGIGVKAWGLSGRLKDTELPDGLLLRGVRSVIGQVASTM